MRGKSQILALAGVAVGVGAFAWWWWSRRQEAGAAGEELQPIDITAQRMSDPLGLPDSGAPAPLPESSLVGTALDWVAETASRAGALVMSRGYRNNNPGNIRTLPAGRAWNGQIGDDGGYGVYDTPQHGTRALGVGPDEALDVRAVLPELARAIARHENGYVAADYDWQWVYL